MMETRGKTGIRNLSWHILGVIILCIPFMIDKTITWPIVMGAITYNVIRWIIHYPHDRLWFWYWKRKDKKEGWIEI